MDYSNLDEDYTEAIAEIMESIQQLGKEEFEKVILKPATAQNFPLKNPTINYITKNASAALLKKLYHCCKYFFFKRPFVIVEKLCLVQSDKEIVSIYPRPKYASQLINIWLTGSLDISASDFTGIAGFPQAHDNDFWKDEKIFKNVTQNDIKVLSITAAGISLQNLQILCSSKFLYDVTLDVRFVKRDDQSPPVSMEDILQLVPYVQKLSLCHCYCNAETTKKLLTLKFENKVQHFRFKYIKNEIDPKQFFMFFMKNLANNGRVEIKFDNAIPDDRRKFLAAHLTAYMKNFNAKYRNKIFISFF